MTKLSRTISVACLGGLVLAGCSSASGGSGDDYPSAEVVTIVPYEAGGNVDTTARALTTCLSEESGGNFVVSNMPGAGGMIGTREVATAEPDGYTMSLSSTSPVALEPYIQEDAGYTVQDLSVVGVPYTTPLVLFVSGDSGIETYEDLVAQSQAEESTIAVLGVDSLTGLGVKGLIAESDLEARLLPAEGQADIARGVLAGDYTASLSGIALDYLPRIESGEIRILAVGGEKVPSYLPEDTPTFADLGHGDILPTFLVDVPTLVPADTPEEIKSELTSLHKTCLEKEEVREAIGPFVPEEFVEPAEVETQLQDLGTLMEDELSAR